MSDWVTIKEEQLSEIEPVKKQQGHRFTSPKRLPWLSYCTCCGHVALKNPVSVLVTKIGCHYERDQRFQTWLKTRHV